MTTQSPTNELNTPKPPIVNDVRFWYSVVEATDDKGKLDYEKLAEMTGYKNGASAKRVFFTKRKQLRMDDDNGVKKEKEKVDAGVKKRGRKKKETKVVKKEKDENEYGFEQEYEDE